MQLDRPYSQHIRGYDPNHICTCLACVFDWNNLCLVLDLAHWQKNFENRLPLPMIARGTNPAWNQSLLEGFAEVVSRAITSSLWYARILELHLDTTVRTVARHYKNPKEGVKVPFEMTPDDAKSMTDSWLERQGPASYEFPFRRDVYLGLTTFIPSRRFSKEQQKWLYQPEDQHLRDLEWTHRIYERRGEDVKPKEERGPEKPKVHMTTDQVQDKPTDETPPAVTQIGQ